MAAKSSTLGTLHELFAQYWLDQMQRVDEETGRLIPLSAAEAAVLRAFLKDNNVQADPADDGDIKALSKSLRSATEGTVGESELDAIINDFQRQMPGIGNMQ
ncbi:hypothetical protein [Providencia phage PSTNGR1]|jgi:hypothetical protein|uniref:Uncharacterized protein n=1 Tax=Providencia phage PSTNGR1 TaxID=2783542 RepID=A0A873WLC3_9CAUD|nr:hypothetical protein [Providencia phage PSTNGR1]